MSRNRFALIFYSLRQTLGIFLRGAAACAWLAALVFTLAAKATPVHAAPVSVPPIITVTGSCDISGNSIFTLTNAGGAMTSSYTWEIYQDGVFLTSGVFLLTASPDPGSSQQLTINGLYGDIMVAVKDGTTPAAVQIASDSAFCENHPAVTINQAVGQSDPANSSPIRFAVVFGSLVTGFDADDVTISGMAGSPGVTVIDSGDHRHFTVEVTGMVIGETVTATIAADVALSTTGGTGAGYGNQASTSTDNQVTYHGPPINTVTGSCDISGNSIFTLTNAGGAMTTNYTWEIYQDAVFLTSGTFSLTTSPGAGSSQQLTINGLYGDIMVAVKDGTTPAAVQIASDSAFCENHPNVRINQASTQTDPANSSPIRFIAVFDSAVTGFDADDVTISGMAGSPGVTVIDSGDHKHFTVEVTGMADGETVTATIAADVALSTTGGTGSGYGNQASTSTDNHVTYDPSGPTVTINQASGQADPANGPPMDFDIVFSEAVTGFGDSDVQISGMAGAAGITVTDSGDHIHFTAAVTGMASGESVTATIPASAALDSAGNGNSASTSTDNTVTYDSIAPTTDITGNPADPTTSTSANFHFSGDDVGGSGIASFQCRLDAGGFSSCASPQGYAGLTDGSHTFRVRSVDEAANVDATPASFTWVVDASAPDTAITSNPPNATSSASASFSFSGNDGSGTGVTSFECRFDSPSFAACSGPQSFSGLSEGSHTFEVRAIDSLGNVDATPASYTWMVDMTAPDTNITGNPADPANSTSATFGFSGSDPGGSGVTGFECNLDGGGFNACSTGITYSGLSAAGHTFEVRAVDAAANADPTPVSFTWTIDITAPTVTIGQAAGQADPSTDSPINFTAVFSEAVTGFIDTDVSLSGTAGATTATVTGGPMTYNVAVSGMTNGGTVIASIAPNKAQDAATNGNSTSTSTDNTVTLTVNTTTTMTSDGPDPSTVGQVVAVNYTVIAGLGTPTGNVTITDSASAASCTATVAAGTCNITLPTSGARMLTATYAGAGTFNGSSDTESHSVSVTLAVNTFTDELNTNGNCSLREAIRAANTNTVVGACPAGSASIIDVITLASGTYTLVRSGTDDTAVNGDLDITGDTKIIGTGALSTFISGLSTDRVFQILSGTVQIQALTVKNGHSAIGAGLHNAGTLTLNNVTVTANTASSGAHGTSNGAGIYNTGTLTLNSSTVSSNTASSGSYGFSRGAGIHNNSGTLTLNSSTVTGNKAISGTHGTSQGGGIYTTGGSTTLNSTTPSGNTVTAGALGSSAGPNTYP